MSPTPMQALQRRQARALAAALDAQVNQAFEALYAALNRHAPAEAQEPPLRDLLAGAPGPLAVLERACRARLRPDFKALLAALLEARQNGAVLERFVAAEQRRQRRLEEERQALARRLDRCARAAQGAPGQAPLFDAVAEHGRLTERGDAAAQGAALRRAAQAVEAVKAGMRAAADALRAQGGSLQRD